MVKTVEQSDRTAKRLFVVEAIELGAGKSDLAMALAISRQTIHNWMETKEHFGIEGLTQGYNSGQSKSRRKQREIHQEKLACGNKSALVAAIRAKDRQDHESRQLKFDFTFAEGNELPITSEEQAFAEEHDWEKTRYAAIKGVK